MDWWILFYPLNSFNSEYRLVIVVTNLLHIIHHIGTFLNGNVYSSRLSITLYAELLTKMNNFANHSLYRMENIAKPIYFKNDLLRDT